MYLNNGILFAGSVCFFMAHYLWTVWLMIGGRLLIGIYTGIGCALIPIYIQELAPTTLKVNIRIYILF